MVQEISNCIVYFNIGVWSYSQVAMLDVRMVSNDCKIHRFVSLVTMAWDNYRQATYCRDWHFSSHFWPILFKIYHFYLFSVWFWQPLWATILIFVVKTVLKHNTYPSIRFAISELTGKDTSLSLRPIWFKMYHWLCVVYWEQSALHVHMWCDKIKSVESRKSWL